MTGPAPPATVGFLSELDHDVVTEMLRRGGAAQGYRQQLDGRAPMSMGYWGMWSGLRSGRGAAPG